MSSSSHNTGFDTRGSFEVSHWDWVAFLRRPIVRGSPPSTFPPPCTTEEMLGTKVSQWSATTSKDALHERAWPDLCLVRGSSVGRLKIGAICIDSLSYYAAEQEGLHRFSPNFIATSPSFQHERLKTPVLQMVHADRDQLWQNNQLNRRTGSVWCNLFSSFGMR